MERDFCIFVRATPVAKRLMCLSTQQKVIYPRKIRFNHFFRFSLLRKKLSENKKLLISLKNCERNNEKVSREKDFF